MPLESVPEKAMNTYFTYFKKEKKRKELSLWGVVCVDWCEKKLFKAAVTTKYEKNKEVRILLQGTVLV